MDDYEFWYNLVRKANTEWKGGFNHKEIACFAYDYMYSYECSVRENRVHHTMEGLCENITGRNCEGITVREMINVIKEYMEE